MRTQQVHSVMIFWGCMIPAVQPFVEKATRFSLQRLGVVLEEMPEATCCPDPEISRTLGGDLWLTLAARNLSIANRTNRDVTVICNGCFDTLTKANAELRSDKAVSEKVNLILSRHGREYNGSSQIYHMISFLHDVVGLEAVRSRLVQTLSGLKCSPQYGCRILREKLDLAPKFDKLVEAFGAELIHTDTERLCCGVPTMYADPDFSLRQRSEVKLREIKQAGAECITLFCPACAERIERAQVTLRSEGEDFNIPVVNYLELLALCLGASPSEIGVHLHRIPLDPILGRIMKTT
jgi:heterodisulfide reductase subunit B